jgi:hypothetical protein
MMFWLEKLKGTAYVENVAKGRKMLKTEFIRHRALTGGGLLHTWK